MRLRNLFLGSVFLALVLMPVAAWSTPGDVVAKYATPSAHPTGLVFDGKSLWMADLHSGFLYEINPADGKLIRKLTAPGYAIEGLAYADGRLYVLDSSTNKVYKFNPETSITEKEFPIRGAYPTSLAYDGKNLWLGGYSTSRLTALSTEDGTRVDLIRSPGEGTYGLTFDGMYLWVADRLEDKIYMVWPKNGDVIITLDSPGKYPRGMAYDGKFLWNVDYESDMLYKIVRDDDTQYIRTEGKKEKLELVEEIRNYGPGMMTSADLFFAVPENLPGQQMLKPAKYTPEPKEMVTDQWGQKVAHFEFKDVPAGEAAKAKVKYETELYTVRYFLFPEKIGTLEDIPKEIKDQYLGDGSKFGVNDPYMQQVAKRIVGKEKNTYWMARKILDHVTSKIKYDLDGVWDIAPTVIKRGSGSCSEYSFVFISLCRAAGLPARYVGSVVLRYDDASTDTVYHRWPEVYLPGYGWIPMDPSSNHGIFNTPVEKTNVIGYRLNKYLITTHGGGPSKYLDWEYNTNDRWQYKGPCKIQASRFGEWEPIKEPEKAKAEDKEDK